MASTLLAEDDRHLTLEISRPREDDPHARTGNAESGVPRAQCALATLRQGIGLATDLYDLSVVNIVRPEFESCYGELSPWENGALTSASHGGAIVGQLLFGVLADLLGRRGTFIATAALMCVSAAGAAAAAPAGPLKAWQVLLFWRFLLGVGIGGEYPLSGAVTAEHASAQSSAWQMAGLNFCFLSGQVLAPLVVMACFYAGASDQATWRAGIGGGAVLALAGALLRGATMQESRSWTEARRATRELQAEARAAALRGAVRPLAGTMLVWLVYDIIGYGTGGYTTTLFKAESREGTLWNVLKIVALSAPGYFFTFCIGRFGRRCFQSVGFTVMGLAFFLMSFLYGRDVGGLEVIIFGVQKSFDAFGPGATTFIIPAEIFPTVIRASCHGLSAASGKVGAFVGTLFLPPMQEAVGFQMVLAGCGVLCLVGLLLTFALTPPYDAETLRVLADTGKTDLGGTTRILWSRRGGTASHLASARSVG